jgi:hypothetical protein
MDEQYIYISLSPIHKLDLQKRLSEVLQTKKHVTHIIKTFKAYAAAGSELCMR